METLLATFSNALISKYLTNECLCTFIQFNILYPKDYGITEKHFISKSNNHQ